MMSRHGPNREQLTVDVCTTGTVHLLTAKDDHDKGYIIHGAIMYSCWTVLSLLQIYLGRYLRHKWRWNTFVHSVIGSLILALTIFSLMITLSIQDFKISKSYHTFFGLVSSGLIIIMISFGILTMILRSGKCCNMDWKT